MSSYIKGLCRDIDGSVLWGGAHLGYGGDGDPQHHSHHYSKQH